MFGSPAPPGRVRSVKKWELLGSISRWHTSRLAVLGRYCALCDDLPPSAAASIDADISVSHGPTVVPDDVQVSDSYRNITVKVDFDVARQSSPLSGQGR